MTRREWLKRNPPPAPAGPLFDRAAELDLSGDKEAAAKMMQQARAAMVAGKCPVHPTLPLYRHQNRQEDLFVCKQGPHFLWWTLHGGRAQFLVLGKLDLPDLDGEIK